MIDGNISDISFMFEGANQLLSISDNIKDNYINIEDLGEIKNYSINSLYSESEKNQINFEQKSHFDDNLQITSLPMSSLEKNNLTNLSNINSYFPQNYSISSLILNNITNMESMLSGCNSLISLPDLSNWNISNVTDMNKLFYDCCSLISLPDISNWDI